MVHAGARPGPTERLSDKDVKTLIDQVDEGRDKFEGNLDGQFKGSTVRGPSGETKVAGALQDYQDNTQKLKDRFTPDYSASAESPLEDGHYVSKLVPASPNSRRRKPQKSLTEECLERWEPVRDFAKGWNVRFEGIAA